MVVAMTGGAAHENGPVAGANLRDPERVVNDLEQLAASDPDRHAHRLAWALGSWGDHFWDGSRQDEYLRAYEQAAQVVRLRVDAGIATEQELSDLPQHVGNVASVAFRIGRLEVAFAAAEEAIVRELALGDAPRPPQWDGVGFVSRMRALRDESMPAARDLTR
jgi:hypothetical protein